MRQTPENGRTSEAKPVAVSLKALALKAFRKSTNKVATAVDAKKRETNRETNVETEVGRETKAMDWPEPESGTIETVTPAGRYACLSAITSHFGAGLTRNARGGLTLICPSTMPPAAAQAARDGLAELAGYIQGRLP